MTSSASERTRRAILVAAIRVLSANRSASMREVAAEAQVSRSTVHRHYPDRSALSGALARFVEEEYERVIDLLRPQDGTGLDVLLRLCSELYDNYDVFGWWFFTDDGDGEDTDAGDDFVAELVARGHADGSIDTDLTAMWINMMLWSLLYTARFQQRYSGHTRGEVRAVFMTSARKLFQAVP